MDQSSELNRLLRGLPQVDAVLSQPALVEALRTFRHDVVLRLARREVDQARASLAAGELSQAPDAMELAARTAARLQELSQPLLKPVVNAAGILLHTNLGRARLAPAAQRAVQAVAQAYCNLEYDLASGERTRRDVTLEPLLQALTGGEACTVVNNNAAAVYLILHTLAQGREVVTSRGELVEIGGSYRVPDIVRAAGCRLVEVGTTNRVRLQDYAQALSESTALILKTHPSNFRITGFTEETPLTELTKLGRSRGVPVYYDLGSGYFPAEGAAPLAEPGILDALASGVDLVSFSGDKLFGGPQAGIILGTRDLVRKLRQSPLWRVVRIDKFTVAGLGATIAEHLRQPAPARHAGAIAEAPGLVQQRRAARMLESKLTRDKPGWEFAIVEGEGYWGGGSVPEQTIPAVIVLVGSPQHDATALHAILRRGDPPVVGYPLGGKLALSMLALCDGDVERIVQRIAGISDE